ncbi:hypothetical protein PR048_030552 [Dryococelus australis]|uniref:Uncharacterized protein n=1 Tax=Dryococelus australis TaxID=614101 RepID=A0ABQ9GBV8_9NEOP|nr:hypothetical protein PR048_030552 [Dryococelus australis]
MISYRKHEDRTALPHNGDPGLNPRESDFQNSRLPSICQPFYIISPNSISNFISHLIRKWPPIQIGMHYLRLEVATKQEQGLRPSFTQIEHIRERPCKAAIAANNLARGNAWVKKGGWWRKLTTRTSSVVSSARAPRWKDISVACNEIEGSRLERDPVRLPVDREVRVGGGGGTELWLSHAEDTPAKTANYTGGHVTARPDLGSTLPTPLHTPYNPPTQFRDGACSHNRVGQDDHVSRRRAVPFITWIARVFLGRNPARRYRATSVLRDEEGETRWVWSSSGLQGRGKWKIPEKTRRPAASYDTIPICENPGATPPGINPYSPRWEASSLTTALRCPVRCLDWSRTIGRGPGAFGFVGGAIRPLGAMADRPKG